MRHSYIGAAVEDIALHCMCIGEEPGIIGDESDVLLQGKAAPLALADTPGGVKAKVGSEDVRFAAEGKFLSGHLYVSDGIIHGLPCAAKEVCYQSFCNETAVCMVECFLFCLIVRSIIREMEAVITANSFATHA